MLISCRIAPWLLLVAVAMKASDGNVAPRVKAAAMKAAEGRGPAPCVEGAAMKAEESLLDDFLLDRFPMTLRRANVLCHENALARSVLGRLVDLEKRANCADLAANVAKQNAELARREAVHFTQIHAVRAELAAYQRTLDEKDESSKLSKRQKRDRGAALAEVLAQEAEAATAATLANTKAAQQLVIADTVAKKAIDCRLTASCWSKIYDALMKFAAEEQAQHGDYPQAAKKHLQALTEVIAFAPSDDLAKAAAEFKPLAIQLSSFIPRASKKVVQ
jgi:hypothetical protein